MTLRIATRHADLSSREFDHYASKLRDERAAMRAAAGSLYDDDRASINLPLDEEHLAQARALAQAHKGTDLVVVVGIGGSNLGTMAVHKALQGDLHNLTRRPKALFADTVDPASMRAIADQLDGHLKSRKKVLINVISKSGGTTETIANAQVLLDIFKRHRKTYRTQVVCTTGRDSGLWHLAQERGFAVLEIPEKVGGRYSVFSLVGLFPLAVLGIDIAKLLDGAAHMRAQCLREKDNPAIERAAMLAHARIKGRNIANNLYFSSELEYVGRWYRQLMGESIGKEHDRAGKRVHMGMTPTVSIGSTDLHSMAQLYFGGPADTFHTIVRIKDAPRVRVPSDRAYAALVPNIAGKGLQDIMDAITDGVVKVLASQGRPFCEITLERLDETSLGELLQLHMMEMMYLGALFNVNPFDQPNVEAYKIETKRRLAR